MEKWGSDFRRTQFTSLTVRMFIILLFSLLNYIFVFFFLFFFCFSAAEDDIGVSFKLSESEYRESEGTVVVELQLSGVSELDIVAHLEFSGTAVESTDYECSVSEVLILHGTTEASFQIVILDDSLWTGG
jgi:hypothetical protein